MICVIRCLALTASDLCLKLGCFQTTSRYSALEISHFTRYINSRLTYLLTTGTLSNTCTNSSYVCIFSWDQYQGHRERCQRATTLVMSQHWTATRGLRTRRLRRYRWVCLWPSMFPPPAMWPRRWNESRSHRKARSRWPRHSWPESTATITRRRRNTSRASRSSAARAGKTRTAKSRF